MKGEAQASIDDEAVAWFVLLRDDVATGADRARFAAWLDADPRHREAWQDLETLWTGMDDLHRAASGFRSMPLREKPPLAARAGPGRRRGWRQVAAAAAICLAIGSAGFWAARSPGFIAGLLADHRTGAGEQQAVTLPDGSTVILGGSSALSVAFEGAERRVSLRQGEAYFTVRPDRDRPFVVAAADGTITVVGTAFDVKLAGDQVTVGVASGTVEIATGGTPPVRLSPGQSVRYGADGLAAVRAVDAAVVGFWRNGRLVFQDAPLGDVLRDLERYSRRRILVTSGAIAALPVTGVFDTTRPEAALETIARTLPVRLVRLTAFLVLVAPAD